MKVSIEFTDLKNKTVYCWVAQEGDIIGRGNTQHEAIEDFKTAKIDETYYIPAEQAERG